MQSTRRPIQQHRVLVSVAEEGKRRPFMSLNMVGALSVSAQNAGVSDRSTGAAK
jgi:hypothetical protein